MSRIYQVLFGLRVLEYVRLQLKFYIMELQAEIEKLQNETYPGAKKNTNKIWIRKQTKFCLLSLVYYFDCVMPYQWSRGSFDKCTNLYQVWLSYLTVPGAFVLTLNWELLHSFVNQMLILQVSVTCPSKSQFIIWNCKQTLNLRDVWWHWNTCTERFKGRLVYAPVQVFH